MIREVDDQLSIGAFFPVTAFTGLRDFAINELDRARSDLQSVGEPKVCRFRIDGSHLIKASTELAALLAEVEIAIPRGEIAIYYLQSIDTNEEAIALIRAFFAETKQKGDGRSRDNKRNSNVLYVGSSRKMTTRLREHVGFCSRSTYALKLSNWYPAVELPLQLICAAYSANTSATVIGALEDALWERLQPMYGRKGSR